MRFSVIIATYNRVDSLQRLLSSLARHFGSTPIEHEVIVADNSRDAQIEACIHDLVARFRGEGMERLRLVREPTPGKCAAQNTAIRAARGEVLAFFDDDVIVAPEWLTAAAQFFEQAEFDAMQGPILVPPEMETNEDFLRAQYKFRTIDFVEYRPPLREIKTLTGANMAIRREVFDRIGLFNEELGPGRSGISEDVEFARRLIAGGGRIGYEPRAAVYHEVDWSRLTEEFFRKRHEDQGRSRLIFKRQSLATIVPNLLRSAVAFLWYTWRGNVRKQYRAKGRFFHYRAMLLEKLRPTGAPPARRGRAAAPPRLG